MSNRKHWTMRDGSKIRIKDMTDSHLINCMAMMKRTHDNRIDMAMSGAAGLSGELATYYAEQEIGNMAESPAYTFDIYADFEEEARRRGI